MATDDPPEKRNAERASREARRAEALRQNLRRRKAAAARPAPPNALGEGAE
jgi:hypothetical protein